MLIYIEEGQTYHIDLTDQEYFDAKRDGKTLEELAKSRKSFGVDLGENNND